MGGKYIYHTHFMAEGSTLREVDANFFKENWEIFIDGCVIGHMLVVSWFCIQTRIFILSFGLVWVVNAKTQSDEWMVKLKSWVVNYTWHNIQTDIILRNLQIQIRCQFQLTL